MTSRAALAALVIGCAAICTMVAAWSASLHTSATFDEIALVSGGARGVELGRWDVVSDQPPLMMYLYGWASAGAEAELPTDNRSWSFDDQWDYARLFFFGLGNDPQELLGRARLVASTMAGMLVAAAGGFAWWIAGPLAGGLAAVMTALLPDVLAHGGVAYNDLPVALAFLLALWALEATCRRPTAFRGALVGLAAGAAFGIKLSALALAPVGVLLVGAEAWAGAGDRAWWRALGVAFGVGGLTLYASLVLLHGGDATLAMLRFTFWRTVFHATSGHDAPAYLLGQISAGGWWYYFPVAFVFKTPAAFQVIVALGVGELARAGLASDDRVRIFAAWRGRAPVLAILVFGAFLLRSDLNSGFRHALPLLPLLAVVGAVGVVRWAASGSRLGQGGMLLLIGLQAASVLSAYPHLLAYSSVWAGGRDRAYRVIADSSLDWGQGLLDLRAFMDEEAVASVRLSYFGSARPEAYGIEYVALPSFFRLPLDRTPNAEASPRFTVISATNLLGIYLQGRDPFAAYRDREPYRILGHTLFVFDEG